MLVTTSEHTPVKGGSRAPSPHASDQYLLAAHPLHGPPALGLARASPLPAASRSRSPASLSPWNNASTDSPRSTSPSPTPPPPGSRSCTRSRMSPSCLGDRTTSGRDRDRVRTMTRTRLLPRRSAPRQRGRIPRPVRRQARLRCRTAGAGSRSTPIAGINRTGGARSRPKTKPRPRRRGLHARTTAGLGRRALSFWRAHRPCRSLRPPSPEGVCPPRPLAQTPRSPT